MEGLLSTVRRGMEPLLKKIKVYEDGFNKEYEVKRVGIGVLNTAYGKFWEYIFEINDSWKNYNVIVKADINGESLNPIFLTQKYDNCLTIRTDSGCLTGQVFGDRTCECLDQLNLALKTIEDIGEGIVINIPGQDGRGMGLAFKLATMWLQDNMGVDTVESAYLLTEGGKIDARTYSGVVAILKFFDISNTVNINLATNNPLKEKVFIENGFKIRKKLPMIIAPNEHTVRHLRAKRDFLGHNNLEG